MWDFQKLEVYQKSKNFSKQIAAILSEKSFDRVTNDQMRRASFSIMLNIAEGTSRFSNKDRKNFFVVARGSAFECVAILEYLLETQEIDHNIFTDYEKILDEISRMLFGLIKNL
ncbi:MAG: four helix bundle protein [Deltaproteobacteria bacterium]|nr:four helix bundle protein [Deltaproteobacteria bacterium]